MSFASTVNEDYSIVGLQQNKARNLGMLWALLAKPNNDDLSNRERMLFAASGGQNFARCEKVCPPGHVDSGRTASTALDERGISAHCVHISREPFFYGLVSHKLFENLETRRISDFRHTGSQEPFFVTFLARDSVRETKYIAELLWHSPEL